LNDSEIIGMMEVSLANAEETITELRQQIVALKRIAAQFNEENVALKQKMARLESSGPQTVYPWKAE